MMTIEHRRRSACCPGSYRGLLAKVCSHGRQTVGQRLNLPRSGERRYGQDAKPCRVQHKARILRAAETSRRAWVFVGVHLWFLFSTHTEALSAAEPDPETTAAEMVTPETQAAIDRGLAYLADHQDDDGAFGRGGYSRNVATVALSGMAFLSAGSTPGRGPYGDNVARCVDYLLLHAKDSGFITAEEAKSHGPMYGHGFATLFLAECNGMASRDELREKLTSAVDLIVATQNEEGGWRYEPARQDADLSVTVCQVMALRAARNAGVRVPAETIDRAIDYVRRCQNPDGGFMYMSQGGQSMFPRSAAGVVALYSAGIYEGQELERGLEYLEAFNPKGPGHNRANHYFYGHYYAVQAMWHAGGERWTRWYPAIREALIVRQRDDGAWLDSICPEYGTAMACIILQMPNNYLPIFQR